MTSNLIDTPAEFQIPQGTPQTLVSDKSRKLMHLWLSGTWQI